MKYIFKGKIMNKKELKENLVKKGWMGKHLNKPCQDNLLDDILKIYDQLLQAEREKMWSKDKIELSRTIGEWQGMLEGICQQNIPQELKDTLEVKIAELRGTK